ncbi:MAG: cytochrome C oxidase subunit IV family protein [Solirubrobacterales bacterium]
MSPARAALVYLALIALLAATVGATFLGLGPWTVAINLAIAAAKAGLILWFFMELGAAPGLVRLFAFGTLAWLAVLFGLGWADWLTR